MCSIYLSLPATIQQVQNADIPLGLLLTDYVIDPDDSRYLILNRNHVSGTPLALLKIDRWNSLSGCLQVIHQSRVPIEVRRHVLHVPICRHLNYPRLANHIRVLNGSMLMHSTAY